MQPISFWNNVVILYQPIQSLASYFQRDVFNWKFNTNSVNEWKLSLIYFVTYLQAVNNQYKMYKSFYEKKAFRLNLRKTFILYTYQWLKSSNVIKKPDDVRRRNSGQVTINCDVFFKYHWSVIQNWGLWWNKMCATRNINPI